jgi:hypothetical protein
MPSKRSTVNFLMLNPSVADAEKDDATIRKCMGFARRWGYTAIVVTNLIPIISTDPWKLPPWAGIEMKNRLHLKVWMHKADRVIFAWGSVPAALARTIGLAEHIYNVRRTGSGNFYCIGRTSKGAPLHPSRAPYTAEPEVWTW